LFSIQSNILLKLSENSSLREIKAKHVTKKPKEISRVGDEQIASFDINLNPRKIVYLKKVISIKLKLVMCIYWQNLLRPEEKTNPSKINISRI